MTALDGRRWCARNHAATLEDRPMELISTGEDEDLEHGVMEALCVHAWRTQQLRRLGLPQVSRTSPPTSPITDVSSGSPDRQQAVRVEGNARRERRGRSRALHLMRSKSDDKALLQQRIFGQALMVAAMVRAKLTCAAAAGFTLVLAATGCGSHSHAAGAVRASSLGVVSAATPRFPVARFLTDGS